MEKDGGNIKGLPENAYRPLKEGEKYTPFIPASKSIAEITLRSVGIGVLMAVIFSFSACYLGLVAGHLAGGMGDPFRWRQPASQRRLARASQRALDTCDTPQSGRPTCQDQTRFGA